MPATLRVNGLSGAGGGAARAGTLARDIRA
jgi:hypothetical protein